MFMMTLRSAKKCLGASGKRCLVKKSARTKVVVRAYEGDANGVILHDFTDEKVTARDVLSALVVLGVVGQVAGSLIVAGKSERTVGGRVDLVAEGLEVDAIFGSFREGDDFGFRAGKSNRLLRFGTEEDSGHLPADEPTRGGPANVPVGVGEGVWVRRDRGVAESHVTMTVEIGKNAFGRGH